MRTLLAVLLLLVLVGLCVEGAPLADKPDTVPKQDSKTDSRVKRQWGYSPWGGSPWGGNPWGGYGGGWGRPGWGGRRGGGRQVTIINKTVNNYPPPVFGKK